MTSLSTPRGLGTLILACVLGSPTPRLAAQAPHEHPHSHPHGHDHGTASTATLRIWRDAVGARTWEAAFLAHRADEVVLEKADGTRLTVPLAELSSEDRAEVERRVAAVRALQLRDPLRADSRPSSGPAQREPFARFAPFVRTRWDERWLYVESDGLPHAPVEHPLMVGIRSWQQQVPLPQPYTGDNAWRIPLAPRLAEQPISGRQALMRGAIALAANGVPIFNALNNRGEDANLAGELDEYGGHSGRSDDYHYHMAPLHLQKVLGKDLPIAYALDGYAILGVWDPAAKPGQEGACALGGTEPLDAVAGHFGAKVDGKPGVYHYHASRSFPYVNGGVRGKVEVVDDQIEPQPRARGVRPAQTPLRGAVLTNFRTLGPASWAIGYTLFRAKCEVRFRIAADGNVHFEFVAGDGTTRTEVHEPRGPRAPRGAGDGQDPARPESRPRGGRGGTTAGSGGPTPRGPLAELTGFRTQVPVHDVDCILVRPTASSVALSVVAAAECTGFVEYGEAVGSFGRRTDVQRLRAGDPALFELSGLKHDTTVHYRWRSRAEPAKGEFAIGKVASFHTPRSPGSSFTFTVQADSHLDANVTPEVYAQALQNARADRPDFHVDLGDTFMTDKRREFRDALPSYVAQRYYFGLLCDSAPLFMALGNHDGESGSVGGGSEGMAAWSFQQRTRLFPPPEIGTAEGAMYSGRTSWREGRGAHYYAFSWGDALCVVLDPFWATTERIRGGGPTEELLNTDQNWARTLGREQYEWLARTLRASQASFRFVFLHHLVGGLGKAARGGVEAAPYFEWGGKNADGTFGFAARRPGWGKPIHDLLVENRVSAVFHGHDHVYVRNVLDGIVYQCVPQPGNARGGTRMAADYGYTGNEIHGSPGHVRVTVDGKRATVAFVRAALGEARGGRRGESEANRAVVAEYEILPRNR